MTLPDDIERLVLADKRFLTRPKWDYESDARYAVFTVPLDTDLAVSGLELRAKVANKHVDRDALFQLEYARSGRDRVPLARLQFRPFETHTNPGWGPPGHEFARFYRASHHHAFEHNYDPDERRMRTPNLRAAVPIMPEPRTFSDFVAFCGMCFIIKNISLVEPPLTGPDLFWRPL